MKLKHIICPGHDTEKDDVTVTMKTYICEKNVSNLGLISGCSCTDCCFTYSSLRTFPIVSHPVVSVISSGC